MKKLFLLTLLFTSVAANNFAGEPGKKLSATLLTNWLDFHCQVVRSVSGISHVAYSRHFSYTAIAVYESMVGSDASYKSLSGQLSGLSNLPLLPSLPLSPEATVNATYATLLRNFYGDKAVLKARIDSMESAMEKTLLSKIDPLQADRSRKYANELTAHIINWASADGSISTKKYSALQGEGVWAPVSEAAAPFWAENRSMVPAMVNAFAIVAPSYSSDKQSSFYQMANEVYTVSKQLTAEQKAIALFWDDSPNGKYMTAFGHWTSILSGLIREKKLSLSEASEAFVRMTIAMHDAAILAWKGKYQYNVVRPITYIQQHIDKEWKPLISTPPHPEFPAAHATISNAAAVALTQYFGAVPVTDKSYVDIGMPERKFSSLLAVAKEAGISRLYGGIHYRYSIEQGFTLGEAVANLLNKSISFHIKR